MKQKLLIALAVIALIALSLAPAFSQVSGKLTSGSVVIDTSGWNLKGDKGETGSQGIQGVPGKDGKDGLNGVCPPCPPSSGGGSGIPASTRFVTDWNGLVTAWNDVNAGTLRSITIAGNITMQGKLRLADNFNKILYIQGNGYDLTIPASVDTGFVRTYSSLTAANNGIDAQLRFSNIIFKGSNNVGIAVSATYGSMIEGCRFSSFNKAIYSGWQMGGVYNLNYFWSNYIGIELDYSRFTGGSSSASQSNHTYITNCKFRSDPGAFSAIKSTAVSGLVIGHNIFEGGNSTHNGSDYEIYFDDASATVVKEVTIYGNHIEQIPAKSAIYIRLKDGVATVTNIYSQYDCKLVSLESSAYGKIAIRDIGFITNGSTFESIGNGCRWAFEDNNANLDPYITTRWVGGIVPAQTYQQGWSTAGQEYVIKINGRKL